MSAPSVAQTITNPLWPGPCLFVPISVECLLIGQPNQTGSYADLRIDYRKVPSNIDPAPAPFQLRPSNDPPGTGAHLQATLPNSFRSGEQLPDGSVQFPPIPNRWVVARSVVTTPGTAPVFTVWVLQSDFLGPQGNGTGGTGTNSYPDPEQIGNTLWLGQVFTVANWANPAGPATPLLRSVGPGSVSWIVTYDNTLNALSFYDPLTDVTSGTVTYAMLGWFNPASFDPLLGVTTEEPQGFETEADWQAILSALQLSVDGEAGLAAAEAAWAAWEQANPVTGGPVLPAIQMQLAGQSLCHGMVFGIAWNGPQQNYPKAAVLNGLNPVTVAIGGTGVEALAAWLAATLNAPDLEDLIVALQQGLVYDYLQQPSIFATRTQTSRFANADGGTVWLVMPPENSQDARGQTLQTVDLSPEQSATLTALNEAQAALDATGRLIAATISELFALAYKQTQAGPFSPYAATVAAAITTAMQTLTGLQATQTAQTATVTTLKGDLVALLGTAFVLPEPPVTAPRFYAPASPTLMIAGAQQDTRLLAPGDDGGVDDSLFCRFTGQTVTGLSVVVPADGSTQVITAADLTSRVTLPPQNSGLPKELTDYLVEVMFFDTANARLLATIAYQLAGVTPSSQQLDTLAATIAAQQTAPWSATPDTTYTEALAGQAVGFEGVVPLKRSVLPWTPPWTPLYMDWEVTWYPTAATAPGMMAGWALDGFDYRWTGTAIGTTSQIITGRSVLGTQIAGGLAEQLADFVTLNPNIGDLPLYQQQLLQQAAATLAQADIVTEAMSDFGAMMLMRQGQMTQITSSDPAEQAFLSQAASAISLPNGTNFYPLRSGHFVLNQLWVVDAFGQILRTTNAGDNVLPIRSHSLTTPDNGGDNKQYVQLVPAIQQFARLDLQLLDAWDDAIATGSASLTSPIAGWLLPNHLDNSVQVFDAAGTPLGEVLTVQSDTGNGMRWDPAPGLNLPYGAPPAIANPHLLDFVLGLLAQAPISGALALQELLDVIDISLWKAAPNPQPSGSNVVVLVGQPVAVVRARIGLSLDGQPAWNQSWADTGLQNDGGLTDIPFTTYVGDIAYDGNGALGYFLDNDYSLLNPLRGFDKAYGAIRGAISAPAGNPQTNLARAMAQLPASLASGGDPGSGYLADDPSISLVPQGPTHVLTVLMDPRGAIPAISGILPIATVTLPPGPVAAMNHLQANFRVGPLLVDPRTVQMPLPANVPGNWSWVARSGVTTWETVANVMNNQPQARIPTAVPAVREGWLTLTPPVDGGRPPPKAMAVEGPPALSLSRMRFHERGAVMAEAVAAVATVYQYRFDPSTLIVGATAAPTLTVTNPSTVVGQGTQTINVQIPVGTVANAITAGLGGTSVSVSDPAWVGLLYANASLPYLALTGPALGSLASVSATLQMLQVNSVVGTAAFQVIESFTGGGSTTLTIVKDNQPLEIEAFYASPSNVAQGSQTTLYWTVTGGSYVLIQPGSIQRPVQGSGAFTDSVSVPVATPFTTYTLQLYTDDRQFKQSVAVGYVGQVGATLQAAPMGPIDTNATSVLTWSSTYAMVPLTLANPSRANHVGPSGTQTVTPGNYLTGNQSTVSFGLQANGYQGPAQSEVTFTFNPVCIRWLRYTDTTNTAFDYSVVNPAPGSPTLTSNGGQQVLTANGPGGGPLVAYLGPGPQLQVQYFAATPNPAVAAGQVMLTYQTLNATAASLAIGLGAPSVAVPLTVSTQTGQTVITAPSAGTVLVLTVTTPGQAPVSSQLDLAVT